MIGQVLGIILILIAVFGFLAVLFVRKKNQIEAMRNYPEEEIEVLPSDLENKPGNKLKVIQSGQTVSLLGEDERQILASVTLHEMTQESKGAPWTRTGAISKALVLAGDIFIFKVPSREGGKPIWLKASEIDTFPLVSFYKGKSKENPGPARLFYQKGQTEPVDYELPNNLTPGITWQVIDIGSLNVEIDGESFIFENDDHLYFVTSIEKGGQRRLLYLDARKGEAVGTGGLFLCEPFEPSVDIKEIL